MRVSGVRDRPTKAQVDARDKRRSAIDEVREHNQRQSRRLEAHGRAIVEESMKDPGVRRRLNEQLDGHASRGSDEECVKSFIRSVGEDNLRCRP